MKQISELCQLLKQIDVEYQNCPKTRKVTFRTNAITPDRLCNIVVVYDETGKIDDFLGEPILQEELEKEVSKQKKRTNRKDEHLLELDQLRELILIESESEDGYTVDKQDWTQAHIRQACSELQNEGLIQISKQNFYKITYTVV